MKDDNCFVGVYWAARHESAQQCARRMEVFLRLLAAIHPALTRWFEQADSLEEALQREFTPDHATLLGIIDAPENRQGPLGFTFGVWTGHAEDGLGASVQVTCGSSAPDASPNLCLLRLPWPETEAGKQILTRPVLEDIMRAMVLAWDPDWGVIVPEEVRAHMIRTRTAFTYVGWLTYITRRWGEVPPLSEVQSIEPIEDKGSLVVLTDEPLSPTPAHLDRCLRVQQHLSARGLLRGF